MSSRTASKAILARLPDSRAPRGASILIYHRIGGGSTDEMDSPVDSFTQQLDILAAHDVVSLDEAIERLHSGDDRSSVVLTFDDGFADLYTNAWPMLLARGLPFTVYVAGGLIGGTMQWEGSAGASQGAPALTWDQLAEMRSSGLCTVGNHTYSHARPEEIDAAELDRCSDIVETHLGLRPEHFAWPWGVAVPAVRGEIERRFRSAVTGVLGRNYPGSDPLSLRRIPVRRTDPLSFFVAKLRGDLRAERVYARLVALAKRGSRFAT